MPQRPEDLTGEARKYWDDVVPGLIETGVAKRSDEPALIAMAFWWEEFLKARALEDTVRGRLTAMQKAHKEWCQHVHRFGLTPSDRANLQVDTREVDPADEFLG